MYNLKNTGWYIACTYMKICFSLYNALQNIMVIYNAIYVLG